MGGSPGCANGSDVAKAPRAREARQAQMAGDVSFDVVSDFDEQELRNALDQVRREVQQRFDFKGVTVELTQAKDEIVLVTDDAEFREDPFEPPLVGHNAVRAYLLRTAELQEQVEFTAERHWVVDPTILVAWHASYVARESRATVRLAGFMTLEMRDGRIARLRQWIRRRDGAA